MASRHYHADDALPWSLLATVVLGIIPGVLPLAILTNSISWNVFWIGSLVSGVVVGSLFRSTLGVLTWPAIAFIANMVAVFRNPEWWGGADFWVLSAPLCAMLSFPAVACGALGVFLGRTAFGKPGC